MRHANSASSSTGRSKTKGPATDAPHVAILVETSTSWGRRLITGITNYAVKHGPWHLWVEPRGRTEAITLPREWAGDGVIARVGHQKLADELAGLGVPVVNVSGIELKHNPFPKVVSDYDASAELVAEHFLERGYRQFAYVGPLKRGYVRRHADAFRRVVEQTGYTWHEFHDREPATTSVAWSDHMEQLGNWLAGLPKPLGVFSWATSSGGYVLDVCRDRDIAVPDEVAVVAGDDDPVLCNATVPSLTGTLVASEQIGAHAAAWLDRLMHGEQDDLQAEEIAPIQVTTRGSSEALAIEDTELRSAVIFLRQNAYRPISVDEIANAVPMTRRSLERKFRRAVERTPYTEIQRLRLARVRELLARTDLSIAAIADRAGFSAPEQMTKVFRQAFETTPLRFRSSVRGR